MNIILIGKYRGKPVRYQIGSGWQLTISACFIMAFSAAIAAGGFYWGTSESKSIHLTELEQEIGQQKHLITEARRTAESELDALTARMGLMQAHVTRLNALGQRLIKISKVDPKEFDFSRKPAFGGPHEPATAGDTMDFGHVMGELSDQLESREQQLSVLENVIISNQLLMESTPSGRPIKKGWISSYYGMRTDPFSGKQEMHKGMDLAGKAGSEVVAVSHGVVTWSGPRYGYGNMVEINHGNGYTTRYGHNAELLVQVGDSVEKGQAISLMGSTGRSTGPHVHFEVLLNDRHVDPLRFVQSAS